MSAWQSDPLRPVAERVCTPRELEVVKLRCRGLSWRSVALVLGISRAAARDRWQRAARKITDAGGQAALP